MAPRKPNIRIDVGDAPTTRRSTRSSAIERPTPVESDSAQTSRPTSASSMDDFITSPIKKDFKSSPKTGMKRKSKSHSPHYDETAESLSPSKTTRKSSRKTSNEPVYEVDDIIADPLEFIQTQATNEELESWKGWVELESEPVSEVVRFCLHHKSTLTCNNSFRTELTMI